MGEEKGQDKAHNSRCPYSVSVPTHGNKKKKSKENSGFNQKTRKNNKGKKMSTRE